MKAQAGATAAAIEGARGVADAVLFEGYMLYPYRANDPKNQVRWQFGVLAPPSFAAIDTSERTFLQSDCLLEGSEVELSVQARFLQVQRRTVEGATAGGYAPVGSLDVGEATYLPWDEAVVHESTARFTLPEFGAYADDIEIHVDGGIDIEALTGPGGSSVGRLVRIREPLDARLSVEAEPLPGPYGVRRLRLRLENRTRWRSSGAAAPDRPDALRSALVAAHLLVSVAGGTFVSLIDPPEWATGYAAACEQAGAFPVLAGPVGDRHLVLVSPIILYDHPLLAPESVAQFCDATEMDEMLTLRTLTLTDAERRQARGSDARAAALVDQIDDLPVELMDRLHGAIRSMTSVASRTDRPTTDPPTTAQQPEAPTTDGPEAVVIGGVAVAPGTSVRLNPGSRRADAQDMFLRGRTARVEAVLSDVDGGRYLAVTLDDLAEFGSNPHGRFLYFAPDEVDPIGWDA